VVKHARANEVSIVVTRKEGSVLVVIEDDGRGIASDRSSEGVGLIGMRERLELLEGRLAIESSDAGGTTIAAEVPIR
jgi:two-component system NarL family sensor kinase